MKKSKERRLKMDFPKTHFELMEEHYQDFLESARSSMRKFGWLGYFRWVANMQDLQNSLPLPKATNANYLEALKNKTVQRTAREGGAYIRALLEYFASVVTDPYNIEEISDSPEFKQFYATFETTTQIEKAKEWQAFSMILNKAWHEACHNLSGRRVYQVSPGLAQRLRNTELRGLSSNDIRLPYRSIYLTVPSEAGIQVYNEQTAWHEATGIYIIETQEKDDLRVWSMLVIGKPKSEEPLDDALIFFKVFLPADLSMTDVIEINETAQKHIFQNLKKHFEDFSAFDYIVSQWRVLFTFCMNAVIYATWPDAEKLEVLCNPEVRKAFEKMKRHPKNSNQYQKARGILRSQDHKRRIVLGRSVPLLEERPHEHQEGTPLAVRTLVQGHWHSYWTGEGRTTKIWKFIQPYWKGPNMAPETEPRHVLV